MRSLEPSNSAYTLIHVCKESYKSVHCDTIIAGKNCAIAGKNNTVPPTHNSVNKWTKKNELAEQFVQYYHLFTDTLMFVKVFKIDWKDTHKIHDGLVVGCREGNGRRRTGEKQKTLSILLQLLYFFFLKKMKQV